VKAVVVGAGAWGTAFARLLADRGHDVTLAGRDSQQAREGGPPRAGPDDRRLHDRRTKSIETGTPSSSTLSRSRFSTQYA